MKVVLVNCDIEMLRQREVKGAIGASASRRLAFG